VARLTGNLKMSYTSEKSVRKDAERLAQVLLQEPLASEDLSEIDELIFAPHSLLHRLPAAFLPFIDNGKRYPNLVLRFKLRTVPFAGVLLDNRPRDPVCARPLSPIRLLTTEDIPDEKAEVAAVTQVYDNPFFATRRRASRADLFTALESVTTVHASLHGSASDWAKIPTSASREKPDKGFALLQLRDGPLTVFDLLAHPRPFCAELVVLASCHVGRGRRSDGDEETGVARALLARQVQHVIGALWVLDGDGPSAPRLAPLMAELHRNYRQTRDAAQALAEAQRQAIARHTPAAIWTGLMVLGK
jgi:CHAT domain-containing protein